MIRVNMVYLQGDPKECWNFVVALGRTLLSSAFTLFSFRTVHRFTIVDTYMIGSHKKKKTCE
jgi:hypothetical protein